MTLTGPSAGVTISGNNQSQVFVVGDGVDPISVTISDLTITQGYVTGSGNNGGGVLNNANSSLTLLDCLISDNTAASADDGGGVDNAGTLVVTDCTFYGDTAAYNGGGLANTATATVTDSTFTDDSANNPFNSYAGGAMFTYSTGATTVNNTVMYNDGGHDIGLTGGNNYTTGDYDWSGDGEAPGAHSKAGDPLIGPLGQYGGPTETIPLLPGSQAIGAGSGSRVPVGVTTDQRGLLLGNVVDLGAFQTSVVVEWVSGILHATPTAATLTLADAVGLSHQYSGLAITFDPAVFSSPTTITLTGSQLLLSNTALSTSITGPGATLLSISGNHASQVFTVASGVSASMSGLTITGGIASYGGGLYNLGTLTSDRLHRLGQLSQFPGRRP